MFSDPVRSLIVVVSILGLSVSSASAADGVTHMTVPPNQILSLVAFAPNDNSQGHVFTYDTSGPTFKVPDGYVFVVTDVRILPNLGTFAATSSYLVVVNFGNGRFLAASFLGAGYDRSFTTGFVTPSGTTPTARNTLGSFEDVSVYMQGYLMKGTALPPHAPF